MWKTDEDENSPGACQKLMGIIRTADNRKVLNDENRG